MAKRTAVKSLESVANNLGSQDDASAKESQTRKLEMIQRINTPTFRTIPVEKIFTDYEFNPREIESYGIDANPELAESLKTYGIDPSKPPITLSEQSWGDRVGEFLTLRGNIRMSCVFEMNRDAERAGLPIPFPEIPAMVYTGLSRDDETLIMADHSGQKDLNRYELALMVGRASLARRWTDKEGSAYFGMSPSTCQRLRQIYLMPPVLDDLKLEVHYSKRKKAAGSAPVADEFVPHVFGQTECQTLYNGYLKDQAEGRPVRDCSGLNFEASWQTVFDKREGKDPKDKSKVKKASDLETVAKTYADSPVESVADAAKLVAWAKGADVEAPYIVMQRMQAREQAYEAKIRDLTDVVETLRGENAEMLLTIRRKDEHAADLEKTIDYLKHDIETLKSDRAALADALPKAE